MKLSDYVRRRNGVPMGHTASFRNNMKRSLGAKNFSTFWVFWNPIFGYYLGTKIFRPLKKIFPLGISLILTFIFCGIIHDVITTFIRGRISLFFSVWFLLMSIIVIISKCMNYDLSHLKWIFRALLNVFIISSCFLLTKLLNMFIHFY